MGRKEVLSARRELESYYNSCKLETPEEVAKLFEVYTKLIWVHHQAGLVYDYYCDETMLHHEGSAKMVGGVDVMEKHTIPSFAAFPQNNTYFLDIFCVGNEQDGYRFGQATTHSGLYAENGYSSHGMGDGVYHQKGHDLTLCQCDVKKINGRWVVDQEYLVFSDEVSRRKTADSRPFFQTILDSVQGAAETENEEGPCAANAGQ